MPAWSVPSTSTVWFTTIEAWSANWRYWRRYISRSDSASTLRAGLTFCGMQLVAYPHMLESKAAVGSATRLVNVSDGESPHVTLASQI